MPKSTTGRSFGKHIVLKETARLFQNACAILHSQQQCMSDLAL